MLLLRAQLLFFGNLLMFHIIRFYSFFLGIKKEIMRAFFKRCFLITVFKTSNLSLFYMYSFLVLQKTILSTFKKFCYSDKTLHKKLYIFAIKTIYLESYYIICTK